MNGITAVEEKKEMAKYIDADKVLKLIEDSLSEYSGVYSSDMLNMWGLFSNILHEQPAADVVKRVHRGRRPSDDLVEVVRCHQCKYHTTDDECTHPNWDSDELTISPKALDMNYCSHGVRKDG